MEFTAGYLEDIEKRTSAPAAIFTHSDERGTVGWLPHPGLIDFLCNDIDLTVVVDGRTESQGLAVSRSYNNRHLGGGRSDSY
jgi:hypothetical protein